LAFVDWVTQKNLRPWIAQRLPSQQQQKIYSNKIKPFKTVA